jgi:addiction module RelE/StbE family toxin
MTYSYEFSEDFSETLAKIKKKDKLLFERVSKKILEIVENPLHYKPLRNVLKGKHRVHIGSFVLIFEVVKNVVRFIKLAHHDEAYY